MRNQLLAATLIFLDYITEPIRDQVKSFKIEAKNCGGDIPAIRDKKLIERFKKYITEQIDKNAPGMTQIIKRDQIWSRAKDKNVSTYDSVLFTKQERISQLA